MPVKSTEIAVDSLSLRSKNKLLSNAEYKTKSLKFKDDIMVPRLRKPKWIRAKAPSQIGKVSQIKSILRQQNLHSVCEEASCPNLGECFSHGTATFMIMGDICTRKCPFCDVNFGRPKELDIKEPLHLAETIAKLDLKYVVITSVDRDDLRDGGAQHFIDCIASIRKRVSITIETLVPDFRGRLILALDILKTNPPDILNHNLETTKLLYPKARPGASYQGSLDLLEKFKLQNSNIPTKSGLMLGLGETKKELLEVMQDLRNINVDMLTLGQYLQPSIHHLQVKKYWTPDEFKYFEEIGYEMGFSHVASGPMVRSSYHADIQAKEVVDIPR